MNQFGGNEVLNFQFMRHIIPLLTTSTLSRTLGNGISSLLGNKHVLNEYNLFGLCTLILMPIILTLCGNVAAGKYENMSYTPSLAISIVGLAVYQVYYLKRSHRHGGLLTEQQLGHSVLAFISVSYFVTSSVTNNEFRASIPFFLGSILVSILGAIFASVSDSWYTVGTGQFFMVSLDTIGILFYFVLPIVMLLTRFVNKYSANIDETTKLVAISLMNHLMDTKLDSILMEESQFAKFMVMFLTLPSMLGLPLLQNLCPINGHLFGRVFVHGNQSTKKAALCVNYSDNILGVKALSGNDDNSKNTLNIFVTLNDLKHCADTIKKLHKSGCTIGLRLTENDNNPSVTLKEASELCEMITGLKPSFYHTGIYHAGKLPRCYQIASSLNMRSILWSVIVKAKDDISYVKDDLQRHGGGNIVYICTDDESLISSALDCMKANSFQSETLKTMLEDSNRLSLGD